MNTKKKKDWDRLLEEWNQPAGQTYLARQYTQRFPDDMFGWVALADGLVRCQSFPDALKALRKAQSICPKEMKGFIFSQIGHFYRGKGNHRRSESWYRKALEKEHSQEYLVFLGASLLRQSKFEAAKKQFERAVRVRPSLADEAFFNLGLVYRGEENYVEALRYFEKAIGIDPEYNDAIAARDDILGLFELRSQLKKSRSGRLLSNL